MKPPVHNPAMAPDPLPWPVEPAPDPLDPALDPVLSEPMAGACATPAPAVPPGLRSRLLARSAASRALSAPMVTVRRKAQTVAAPADGVITRTLYIAPTDRPLRPGEPQRARLVELAPGGRWAAPDVAGQSEWLVLAGTLHIGTTALAPRDYHVVPASQAPGALLAGPQGARLFVRESPLAPRPGEPAQTVRDAEAGWPEFAPGVRRRVLWQRDGQAAMLYHTQPGATVPHHGHDHDEECLMVQGELFLDDLLLREGDYQLAPAGSEHRITETDTGVVLYAHGDLDLKFVG